MNIDKLLKSDCVTVKVENAKMYVSTIKRRKSVKVVTYIALSKDAVDSLIPYNIICETRFGALWDTAKRQRLWDKHFSVDEQRAAKPLFAQSRTWYRTHNIPEEVRMEPKTFDLWQKIGEFCSLL